MKAVIGMLHSKYIHSGLAPWYLLEGVKLYGGAGITAEVVEGTVNMPVEDAAARIVSGRPDAVGLCCYIWNITYIKKLLPLIKRALPDAAIILGGPEVSYNAGEVLTTMPLVDYVISGEGERPFAQLLSALSAGESTADIPGVCCRTDAGPVVKAPYCPADIPPSPYSDTYFKALGGRIAYLETSRGCPFSCAFCLSGRGERVRYFPLERAKKELILLANSGTQTVKLVDRTFNADRKRAREIFAFLIKSYGVGIPKGVCFHFEIAGDLLDGETLVLLQSAPPGLIQFEIGLQSFNAETLTAINRKTDVDRLKANIARLMSSGTIHIHVDLIAGLPLEDLTRFAESFNTAYALGPHTLQLGFLKLLHGSDMRAHPEAFPCAYEAQPPYSVTSTTWLTAEELRGLHDTEAVLDKLYNSGRFRRTLGYVLRQTNKTPFELFWDAGRALAEKLRDRPSLDDLTAMALTYFSGLDGVLPSALRDCMVCDRLATNASGKLPASLRVADRRLKRFVKELEGDIRQNAAGGKRGYALLYSENLLVRSDYGRRDPVTGEYPIVRLPLPPQQGRL